MQVQTELRTMFSYSLLPIIVVILLLTLLVYYIRQIKKKELAKTIIIPNHKDLMIIKNNYLQKIQQLSSLVKENKISNRKAYQSLSSLIRHFIFEVTNIKVQNYTLKEIQSINMPILYELVSEYYDPEFSVNSTGSILLSIDKTRTVIEKWN